MKTVNYLLPCWWASILLVLGLVKEKHYFNTFLPFIPPGQQGDVTLLRTFLKVSFQNCVFECKLLRKCNFINYYTRAHTCELIEGNSSEVNVTTKPGMIFGKRTDWNLVSLHMCDSCNDNERCRPAISECENDTCGSPDVTIGTIITGNMFKVNATLRYKCATGFIDIGSGYITCKNNGQWTTLETCIDNSSCPITMNYQSTQLIDGTSFKYWLVNAVYTQAGGATLCLQCHGRLVEIITPEKLTFLRFMLLFKGDGLDYWIDGSNADAINKSAIDAWTTTSGATIPLNDTLWAPSSPDYLNIQHCIRLRFGDDYFLNNHKCSSLFRVICEYVH